MRPRRTPGSDGPRPRRAGSLGRPAGIRGPGASGQRHPVRRRPANPARSGPRRGRPAERLRDHLAKAPAPAGRRPLRALGIPDPRQRLLRRCAAQPTLVDHGPRPADRSAGRLRRLPIHGRSRRARTGVPRPPARPARGVRPAPPRGPAPRGGGRDARHPGRHRPLAIALRDPGPARRLRGGSCAGRPARRTAGMSDQLFEHAVRGWLEDGSDRTPPAAIEAVLLAVKTTPQERDLRIPRRFTTMTFSMRLAAVVAIVAILGVGALAYLNRGPTTGDQPTPPPTTLPTPTPTIRPLTEGPLAPGRYAYDA